LAGGIDLEMSRRDRSISMHHVEEHRLLRRFRFVKLDCRA
jgi:hypothetical protein